MSPVCPTCGSVAVSKRGKVAACMNARCPDNGNIKPAQLFQPQRIDVRPDTHDLARRVALGGGCARVLPAAFCE